MLLLLYALIPRLEAYTLHIVPIRFHPYLCILQHFNDIIYSIHVREDWHCYSSPVQMELHMYWPTSHHSQWIPRVQWCALCRRFWILFQRRPTVTRILPGWSLILPFSTDLGHNSMWCMYVWHMLPCWSTVEILWEKSFANCWIKIFANKYFTDCERYYTNLVDIFAKSHKNTKFMNVFSTKLHGGICVGICTKFAL